MGVRISSNAFQLFIKELKGWNISASEIFSIVAGEHKGRQFSLTDERDVFDIVRQPLHRTISFCNINSGYISQICQFVSKIPDL